MYIHRQMVGLVEKALKTMPVVALTGPRQAGKSTMLRQESLLSKRRYVSLDDATVLGRLRRDPESILGGNDDVTIDEAQKAPEIFPAVKILADREQRPGRFLLSGSANFLLMKAVSESLAGRAVHLHLGPLGWNEISGSSEVPRLVRIVRGEDPAAVFRPSTERAACPREEDWVVGGFPSAILRKDPEARRIWFTGYEQTYLDRDLRDLTQVADIGLFGQFLRLTALRTAQVLNIHDLARDCGSNPMTISRWLSVLEAGFLVRRLPPFFSNSTKRIAKAPKMYFADSGLASFLCGISSASALEGHVLRGAIAETHVGQNLNAMLSAHMPEANLLHYRTHSGEEVDFIVEAGSTVVAIEMKASSRIDARDMKGLEAFVRGEPRCKVGLVLYTGTEVKDLGSGMWAIPLGEALL